MTKQAQKFPQIYRSFPALTPRSLGEVGASLYIIVLKTVVLGAVAAFLALNLFAQLPAKLTKIRQAKLAVMLSPNDISNHLLLVQEYLGQGNMDSVERELTLADSLNTKHLKLNTNKVLGETLSPLKILEEIKAEPQKIKNEISFWEKVVASKPDYRDAYLQLSILHYQIYETQKAKAYLEKAREIDPNFESTKNLEEIFKN